MNTPDHVTDRTGLSLLTVSIIREGGLEKVTPNLSHWNIFTAI